MLPDFRSDLRFALRRLNQDRGFAAVAIATLALGIGANTAIFSVVNGVILKPLAYRAPGQLVAVHELVPKFSNIAPRVPVNGMHYQEWRKSWHSAEQVAILGSLPLNLSGSGEPEKLEGARVSSSLFPMLGIRARLGRTFTDEEDRPGRDRVVVLGDGLWKRRFGGDPNVIGRKIVLDGNPFEIIGVLPADFHFPKISNLYAMTVAGESPEIWRPMALSEDELEPLGDFNFACIARLRAGVSVSQAASELNVIQSRIASQLPEKLDLLAAVVPLEEQITGRSRSGLMMLLGAVSLILLIACVNVANLLLARATGRRREIAIRSAIGASTGRLIRLTLTESLLLAACGGAVGLLFANAAIHVLLFSAPADLPRLDEVRLDGWVLLFATVLTTFSGVFFGLLPAWRLARTDPQDALKSGARGATEGRAVNRLRSVLAAAETGLSALCLIASGLLLHSFVNLMGVNKGFETQHLITVGISLPNSRFPTLEKRTAFLDDVLARLQALPGVTSAGVSNRLPLSGEGGNNVILPEGMHLPLPERPLSDIRFVNPAFFQTMGIRLLEGRVFGDSDRRRHTAVISAMTTAKLWPGKEPLGKRFRMGGDDSPWIEVVGTVGDVRGANLNTPPTLTVYIPYWQRSRREASFAIRTAMDPAAISAAARAAIQKADPEMPVPEFRTMDQVLAASVAARHFQLTLVLLFGAVALLLACLGIYGVVSYSAAQRTGEMGIRAALGAQRSTLLRMVMAQGMAPVAAGILGGVAAAVAMGRLLANLLFGVGIADPFTLAGVVVVLALAGLAACYAPARRVARIDPAEALRHE